MKLQLVLFILLISDIAFCQKLENEFDFINTKVEESKEYILLVKRDYQNFSKIDKNLDLLRNFRFRADKILYIDSIPVSVFNNKYPSKNFQIEVKTKVIDTEGPLHVTYTN